MEWFAHFAKYGFVAINNHQSTLLVDSCVKPKISCHCCQFNSKRNPKVSNLFILVVYWVVYAVMWNEGSKVWNLWYLFPWIIYLCFTFPRINWLLREGRGICTLLWRKERQTEERTSLLPGNMKDINILDKLYEDLWSSRNANVRWFVPVRFKFV